jgi:HD superfamily phosphodiesterase
MEAILKDWHEVAREAARQAAADEAAREGYGPLNYRWEHVQAVVRTALRLSELTGADAEVVEAAAWLHDVAKGAQDGTGNDVHGQQGATIARSILHGTDFPVHKVAAVGDAILKHVGLVSETQVTPLEAAIIWDADKLSKLGALGVLHAVALGASSGQLHATQELSEWLSQGELWPQVAASMNTEPARHAALQRLVGTGDFSHRVNIEWEALDIEGPENGTDYATEALRQSGWEGQLWSPLWRRRILLSPLERALLQTWPLRRLHFLHHNGASAFVYPLRASRLQHTLGVLALVAYFRPDDVALRAAALLHDVGHYPFCHSAELVANVDHHTMTRQRVASEPIRAVLLAHGLDPQSLLDLMEGTPPNPLRTHNGLLHLDHLDSWARQAQAAGYAEMPAHTLLARLSLEGENVATDRATAEYLVRLIRRGNERHYADGDIGPAVVLARALTRALEQGLIDAAHLADSTDEALLAQLAARGDAGVTELVEMLRWEPWRILVRKVPDEAPERSKTREHRVQLHALYDAVPLVAGTGQPITELSPTASAEMARIQALPGTYAVTWEKD